MKNLISVVLFVMFISASLGAQATKRSTINGIPKGSLKGVTEAHVSILIGDGTASKLPDAQNQTAITAKKQIINQLRALKIPVYGVDVKNKKHNKLGAVYLKVIATYVPWIDKKSRSKKPKYYLRVVSRISRYTILPGKGTPLMKSVIWITDGGANALNSEEEVKKKAIEYIGYDMRNFFEAYKEDNGM